MKEEVTKKYVCEYCGRKWNSEELCRKCEDSCAAEREYIMYRLDMSANGSDIEFSEVSRFLHDSREPLNGVPYAESLYCGTRLVFKDAVLASTDKTLDQIRSGLLAFAREYLAGLLSRVDREIANGKQKNCKR